MTDIANPPAEPEQPPPGESLKIAGVELQRISLTHLWVLEEIRHPLMLDGAEALAAANGIDVETARKYIGLIGDTPELDGAGKIIVRDNTGAELARIGARPRGVSMKQVAQAIYVFSDPKAALKTLAKGLEAFNQAAGEITAAIPPSQLKKIDSWIAAQMASCIVEAPTAAANPETAPAQ